MSRAIRDGLVGLAISGLAALGGVATGLSSTWVTVITVAAAVLSIILIDVFLRRRTQREPDPASKMRVGIVNRRGGVADVRRPTFGADLDVGVDNAGELRMEDPRHE